MNLQLSSSKTLGIEGLEILDEEAIIFSGESSTEEDEEEDEEEDSYTKGSQFLEMLGFAKSKEVEDILNRRKCSM